MIRDESSLVILRPNLSKSVRSDFELISDRPELIGGPGGEQREKEKLLDRHLMTVLVRIF